MFRVTGNNHSGFCVKRRLKGHNYGLSQSNSSIHATTVPVHTSSSTRPIMPISQKFRNETRSLKGELGASNAEGWWASDASRTQCSLLLKATVNILARPARPVLAKLTGVTWGKSLWI